MIVKVLFRILMKLLHSLISFIRYLRNNTLLYIWLKIFLTLLCIFFCCEYLIYFIVLLKCKWPILASKHMDQYVPLNQEKPLRVMVIADVHLLGVRNGHWFDKLRREWQMRRSFQTSLFIHHPDVVIILGDIFDEGNWASREEFEMYYKNYRTIFSHDSSTVVKVIAGNHDMGFHYDITKQKYIRFKGKFDSRSTVDLWSKNGVHFVMLNSMAFEGDKCYLCQEARSRLSKISEVLRCISGSDLDKKTADCDQIIQNYNQQMREKGDDEVSMGEYSRPIVLQHFPMFRDSDAHCKQEPDSVPINNKYLLFRPRWDCLSKEASENILDQLEPRLIFSGHTHFSCKTNHKIHNTNTESSHSSTVPEINVASFSWRNLNNPSFQLLKISMNDYEISKCYLPSESSVIWIYSLTIPFTLVWFLRHYIWLCLCTVFSRSRKTQ